MTQAPEPIGETELHAYVDGQLDSVRKAAVEALMAAKPEETERVAAYRRINQELHALYDPLLAEPFPTHWAVPRRNWATRVARIAAGVALVVTGMAGGWFLRGANLDATQPVFAITRQAVAAHVVYVGEVRHLVEVAANEQDHLVAWLSKRMGQPIKAPRLDGEGYTLVGGRLLPPADGSAASQPMYENDRGNRVTLYHVAAPGGGSRETAFRFVQGEGASVFFWLDGALAYALVGKLPRDDLLSIAHAVYNNLNRY
ncbi:MAG: anti-sigma factor [Rhodospirillaceae bacterium]|nr:anti-sigma factor [Rhodospirillaceae bacterium]